MNPNKRIYKGHAWSYITIIKHGEYETRYIPKSLWAEVESTAQDYLRK